MGACCLPLLIWASSPRPPQSDRETWGRSQAESERHSVPLSAAALPTDWGDWEPERRPTSTQCWATGSHSLTTQNNTTPLRTTQLRMVDKHCVCGGMRLLSCVLFREVACHHVGLQSSDVIQVNVLWALMLTPLPHHWHKHTTIVMNASNLWANTSAHFLENQRSSTFPLADHVCFPAGFDVWEALCHVAQQTGGGRGHCRPVTMTT